VFKYKILSVCLTVRPSVTCVGTAGLCSEDDDDHGFNEDLLLMLSVPTALKHTMSAYLADAERSLSMLYLAVKDTFIYYNITIPSSAPAERLFSLGGQIETERCSRICNSSFEKLLLLKANIRPYQQGCNQKFVSEGDKTGGLGTEVPQRGLGAEPWWGSGGEAPRS